MIRQDFVSISLILMLALLGASGIATTLNAQSVPESFVPKQDKSHFQLAISGQLTHFAWPQLRHKFEIPEWDLLSDPTLIEEIGLDSESKSRHRHNISEYEDAYKALKVALKGKGNLAKAELAFERVARKMTEEWVASLSSVQLKQFEGLCIRREIAVRGWVQFLENPTIAVGKTGGVSTPVKPTQIMEFSKSTLQQIDEESHQVFAKYIEIVFEKAENDFEEFSKQWFVDDFLGTIDLELLLIGQTMTRNGSHNNSELFDLDWIDTGVLYQLNPMGQLEAFQYSGYAGLKLPIAMLVADQKCRDTLELELLPHQFDAINPLYGEYLSKSSELSKLLTLQKDNSVRVRVESELVELGKQFNNNVKLTLLEPQWHQLEKIALRRMLYQEGTEQVVRWLAEKYREMTGQAVDLSDLKAQTKTANKCLDDHFFRLSADLVARYKNAIERGEPNTDLAISDWLKVKDTRHSAISISLFTKSCREYLQSHE